MASSYPAQFDTFQNPAATLAGPPTHDGLHVKLNESVAKVQQVLGLNPQGAQADLAARLAYIMTCLPVLSGPGAATGGTLLAASATSTVVCNNQLAAQARTGYAMVIARIGASTDVGGASWSFRVQVSGGPIIANTELSFVSSDQTIGAVATGFYEVAPNTTPTFQSVLTPITETGTIFFDGAAVNNRIDVIFIPIHN